MVFCFQKCKQIAESKEEMSIARPHVSDDEGSGKRVSGHYLFKDI